MPVDIKRKEKQVRSRSYLNKDFDGFRSELLRYARTYFPDRIKDFSETGLGGLFIEMAAHIGDVSAFYMDHQFNELSVDTAIESRNIERHVRNAGIEISGASPATVTANIYIEVPSELPSSGVYRPQLSALPKIGAGTILRSKGGIFFETTDDIDFGETDSEGNLLATVTISDVNSDGTPGTYILYVPVFCVSGTSTTQTRSEER